MPFINFPLLGSVLWGNIAGSLDKQSDLAAALANKADKDHAHETKVLEISLPLGISSVVSVGDISACALGLSPDTPAYLLACYAKIQSGTCSLELSLNGTAIAGAERIAVSETLSTTTLPYKEIAEADIISALVLTASEAAANLCLSIIIGYVI